MIKKSLSPEQLTEKQKKYTQPDLEVFYKTSVQKRDPHFAKLNTINVWDLVTLKDTIRKNQEDEAKLERAHKQRLQMREYYRQ